MKYALLSAVIILAASSPCLAGSIELPKYDAEGQCRSFNASAYAEESHSSNYDKNYLRILAEVRDARNNECIANEQSGYDYLQSVWDVVANDVKVKCLDYGRNAPVARYHSLATCVYDRDQVAAIARQTQHFQP